jgi:serine/threonine-protein kinase
MGVVYRAARAADGAEVAVKTVRPAVAADAAAAERFLREASILKQLCHPNIVAFHDMGRAEGLLYFVMELVPGTNAGRLAREQDLLPVDRAVGLVLPVLGALAHAHGRGFVHRDIKPANILVTTGAGPEGVKLADFGLARAYQASPLSGLTMVGTVAGTAPFMPPEQVLDFRSVRPPSDQYAVAATLYFLLTGHYALEPGSTPQETFKRILEGDVVPLGSRRAGLPKGLTAAVHRALARRPEDRFADVEALRLALLPFAPAPAGGAPQ